MFEMCPDIAYQLSTLHGFYESEAAPLVWALLPNKTQSTYEELFKVIHDAMVTNFGDTGSGHMFLVDYELALKSRLPRRSAQGLRLSLSAGVPQESLKIQYEGKEDAAVRKWVKWLMSLCNSVYVAYLCHRLRVGVAAAVAIDRKYSYRRKTVC